MIVPRYARFITLNVAEKSPQGTPSWQRTQRARSTHSGSPRDKSPSRGRLQSPQTSKPDLWGDKRSPHSSPIHHGSGSPRHVPPVPVHAHFGGSSGTQTRYFPSLEESRRGQDEVSRARERTEKSATTASKAHAKEIKTSKRGKTARWKAESECNLLKKEVDKLKKELVLKDFKITKLEEDVSSSRVLYTKALNNINRLKTRVADLETDLQTRHASTEDIKKRVIEEYCKSQNFDDLVYEEARLGYNLGYQATVDRPGKI
ncbi:hypothetical protein Dimus_020424 [Dionaea muscipula]